MEPRIHVVIGPSVSGKSTLVEKLTQSDQFELITKATTRPPRANDEGS